MAVDYADSQIQELRNEAKRLPEGYRARLLPLPSRGRSGHRAVELRVIGERGHEFWIKLRMSETNPRDFSAILTVRIAGSSRHFHLRRYNGASHWHPNRIEGNKVRGFHIHHATERYQARGFSEEGYAIAADDYSTLESALDRLIDECGFVRPTQGGLFEDLS